MGKFLQAGDFSQGAPPVGRHGQAQDACGAWVDDVDQAVGVEHDHTGSQVVQDGLQVGARAVEFSHAAISGAACIGQLLGHGRERSGQAAQFIFGGKDGFGDYIVEKLQKNGVDCSSLRQDETHPTSVIFVSKSTATPDFVAYRQADVQILESQVAEEKLKQAKIFHTTCFALSKNPAQQTILTLAKKAQSLGLQTSIDINYAEKIWPNKEEAKAVIASYLQTKPIVKLSEDDCLRWFGEEKTDAFIFNYFHSLGAQLICFTKGKKGVVVSEEGKQPYVQPALAIDEIKDATGAGDAFWTGFFI